MVKWCSHHFTTPPLRVAPLPSFRAINMWVRHPDAQLFRATRCRSHSITFPLRVALCGVTIFEQCAALTSNCQDAVLAHPLNPPANHSHFSGDPLVATRESLGDHQRISSGFKCKVTTKSANCAAKTANCRIVTHPCSSLPRPF